MIDCKRKHKHLSLGGDCPFYVTHAFLRKFPQKNHHNQCVSNKFRTVGEAADLFVLEPDERFGRQYEPVLLGTSLQNTHVPQGQPTLSDHLRGECKTLGSPGTDGKFACGSCSNEPEKEEAMTERTWLTIFRLDPTSTLCVALKILRDVRQQFPDQDTKQLKFFLELLDIFATEDVEFFTTFHLTPNTRRNTRLSHQSSDSTQTKQALHNRRASE